MDHHPRWRCALGRTFAVLAVAVAGTAQGQPQAPAAVGQPAPAFTAIDLQGKAVQLSDFKGKHVVLEWTNPGCPYVKKHYDGGNLPATQKAAMTKGVVWLSINSTSKSHQDYVTPADLRAWQQAKGAMTTATVMDPDGKVGRAYGAKTTPHLYVIDPAGKLVYAGGIDSIPSSNAADIAKATNYVNQTLGELLAGKAVSQPVTRAYGCSVKYGDAG
jgi:hypothetical protein